MSQGRQREVPKGAAADAASRKASEGTVVRSVARALAVLSAIAPEGSTLTELAQSADIALPTAHRLVGALEQARFVERNDDGKILFGPAVRRLSFATDSAGHLGWLVRSGMERLRELTDETVTFFIRDGLERVSVACVTSRRPMHMTSAVGTRLPVHLGAAGKVLLAFDPKSDGLLAQIPTKDGIYFTAHGDRPLADLRQELVDIRRTGVAVSAGESSYDACGAASPVFANGRLFGALATTIPSSRYTDELVRELGAQCHRVAREMSEALEPDPPMS